MPVIPYPALWLRHHRCSVGGCCCCCCFPSSLTVVTHMPLRGGQKQGLSLEPQSCEFRRPGLSLQTRAAPRGSASVAWAVVTPCHVTAAAPSQVPPGESAAPNAGALCRRHGKGVLGVTSPAAARSAGVRVRGMPGGGAVGVAASLGSISSSFPGSVLPDRDHAIFLRCAERSRWPGASSPVCVWPPRRRVRTQLPPARRTAFMEECGCKELPLWWWLGREV